MNTLYVHTSGEDILGYAVGTLGNGAVLTPHFKIDLSKEEHESITKVVQKDVSKLIRDILSVRGITLQ